jgi:hypothetical protein
MARFDLQTYVTVQDRISRFWEENPEGAIRTELASNPSQFEQVVFRAEIYKHRDNAHPDATGYAAEVAIEDPRGGPNYTSWHENAETSAIGRAFANMGYATSQKDRPSREEMQKVERGRPASIRGNTGHPVPAAAEEAESQITSWTEAHKVLRSKRIATAEEFAVLTGHDIKTGLTPQQAVDLALSCLADVEAATGD